MRFPSAASLCTAIAGAGVAALLCGAGLSPLVKDTEAAPAGTQAQITIDYPLNGSVFPPEITAPTFQWHDPSESANRWVIEVSFAGHANGMRIETQGPLMQQGTLDPEAGPGIELTPLQVTTHTWRPDAATWEKIKRFSVKSPATIRITGYASSNEERPVSMSSINISTSIDPVGAPLFYRDVPLILPPPGERGPIQPLPQSALPLIKWQMRDIAQPRSHMVMTGLPTCANCHSFSHDGKTMGLDMDGPRNDKGLYALVPVSKNMTIANKNMLRWSSFQVDEQTRSNDPSIKRFGFMAQVSPDGNYVVTSIGAPNNTNTHAKEISGFAPGILDRLYNANFRDIQFSQVFYPTRGILAWYDRKEQKLRPLPGADDPDYVQTSAFWSPDGKYLIYSRATARDPYPAGAPKPQHANDPEETQIQYDLYKIPFNSGRGGKAVPVLGASANGMSNNFPKVSPDGRWIVFVQNKNGLLMRPDSNLYIVPFEGGKARKLGCNLSLMNSWHTFSPNGRWLAFSSKARSPFTQLLLTHIDENGNDTPAILIENTTAANRAVNIPEFVNMPVEGIEKIDPQATESYRLFDLAFAQLQKGNVPEAIQGFREAIERDPDDANMHYILATALSGNDQEREALEEYRKACALSPRNPLFMDHLAISMAINGDLDGSIVELQEVIALHPNSPEYRFNLGFVLESRGDFAAAVEQLEKAVALSHEKDWRCLAELAKVYSKTGRNGEAIQAAQKALDLTSAQHDEEAEKNLRDALNGYQREAPQP
jgi:Flp pilus assembly protein TadD